MDIPEVKYLGTLCKRGHEWENSGKSLRYKNNKGCCYCRKINSQTVEAKKKQRAYYKKNQKALLKKQRMLRRAAGIKRMKRVRNPVEAKAISQKKRERISVKTLDDRYIKQRLGMSFVVPQGLLEAKREVLKLRRLIKKVG